MEVLYLNTILAMLSLVDVMLLFGFYSIIHYVINTLRAPYLDSFNNIVSHSLELCTTVHSFLPM